MTKAISRFLAIVMLVASLFAFDSTAFAATKNDLSTPKTKLTFAMGYSTKDPMNNSKSVRTRIVIKDKGQVVSGGTVTFRSSNKSVCYVKSDSTLVAKKPGKATITVTKKKNKKMKLTIEVTVKKKNTKFSVSPSSAPLNGYGLNYKNYTKETKDYFLLRSYMTYFETVGGGTLTLKKGTYYLPASIYIPSNVKLILADGAVIKKSTKSVNGLEASNTLFQFCAPSKWKKEGAYTGFGGVSNSQIIGQGNATIDLAGVKKGQLGLAFVLCHNKNITISGINFKNSYYGHFIELDASNNVKITNCTFTNQKQTSDAKSYKECINLDTPDKQTGGFGHPWSSYDKQANDGVEISGCTFTDVQVAVGTHMYSQDSYHKNISITSCKITNSEMSAIRPLNWAGVTITGNTFTNCASKSGTKLFYINGSSDINITGNTITGSAQLAQISPYINKGYAVTNARPSDEQIKAMLTSNTISGVKTKSPQNNEVCIFVFTAVDSNNSGDKSKPYFEFTKSWIRTTGEGWRVVDATYDA